eukprot:CAMPEP_0198358414 /NCGR_PEP_ID=MMETSP1450-20131203/130655_1 /TAXON_ID=753684 ORGANISM="Madagascaria erythrocladiodes, Strain CCMP3234" /NCGR_SAMPLE_ID=MMETSP1450 /ASSEMBLY_ACC=CAM_ASM_001115 /LENGTH=54 /DNA_ID=CAMNT_0044065153 /DNA_START=127 /DNA_END=288 /DNA_ORIENTATION=+
MAPPETRAAAASAHAAAEAAPTEWTSAAAADLATHLQVGEALLLHAENGGVRLA